MEVLLLQDVKGVGRKMDVVFVKDGFARNFLIPQGLAKKADTETLRMKMAHDKNVALDKAQYESYLKKMSHEKIVFHLKTGEKGEIFESVKKDRINQELEKRGYHNVSAETKPIKKIGEHRIPVTFPYGIKTTVTIEIVGQQSV